MPEQLNELALRKPEFTEGHRIKLADGQEWCFPKPTVKWHPSRDADGKFKTKRSNPYDAEYQADLQRYLDMAGDDDESINERLDLQMCLAATLLSRNYDLPDDAYERLVPMDGTDENAEMWAAIRPALIGIAPSPKPGAVG